MHKDIRFKAFFVWIRHPAFALLLWSVMGLILGTLFAAFADISCFSLMRQAVTAPVSIVVSFASQLLPFLIAAYAVNISGLWLLYTVCSCKLFSFAYTGSLIWVAFGSAGWLVRWLFLFSDIILVPVLCWYCFRRTLGDSSEKKDFRICIGFAVITALINCLFISPFLAKII
ncbi:MAG: hypothetical protein IJZ15_03160 [Oscillospiraceae bacterium]|nr:hypothetical protein [Oscillospiraceae bacterium]